MAINRYLLYNEYRLFFLTNTMHGGIVRCNGGAPYVFGRQLDFHVFLYLYVGEHDYLDFGVVYLVVPTFFIFKFKLLWRYFKWQLKIMK